MILADANLLLYAVNSDLPQHARAREWWENALSGDALVGLPWVVILAFLRIGTNPRIFTHAMTIEQAGAYVDEWLKRPNVRTLSPGKDHWQILNSLLLATGTAGNATTDAHIAALALEHGYTVHSADNDFKRFAGLRHVNPLQP